jgi:short-chain fatty acids transporter
MLQNVGETLTGWAEKYMPDPFLFALALTGFALGLGLLLTPTGLAGMLTHWHSGFWSFLKFGMQMCLILVSGYALATSGPVHWLIARLSRIPKDTAGAASLIAFVSVVMGYINWGLAIVVGALLAREVAREAWFNGIKMHYPLLGAAGYLGLAVWHGGLSGSAPLKLAENGYELEKLAGVIPVSETLFSPMNLFVCGSLLVGLPVLLAIMAPSKNVPLVTIKDVIPNLEPPHSAVYQNSKPESLAQKIENSFTITLITAGFGLGFLLYSTIITKTFSLSLNWVNFIFLFSGILLHRTPINYVNAVASATRSCAGIILQFPFYAGITGMMKGSGLIELIVSAFNSIATVKTYALWTFFSAALLNLFVPSGGGQWVVQGPIVIQTAQEIGVPLSKAVMAFCYGDQWTNLFQPFWALALLGITGLRAGQIMGYCMVVMLVGFIFFSGVLLIF